MIFAGAWACRSTPPPGASDPKPPADRAAVLEPDAQPALVAAPDSAAVEGPVSATTAEPETRSGTESSLEPGTESVTESAAASGTEPADATPALAPADVTPALAPLDAPPVAHEDEALAIHGYLLGRWRLRRSGDAHDQDAYGVLAVDVGDAESDRLTAHFLARLSVDLDGQGDAESQQVFGSLQDTYGDSAHLDLYEASLGFDRPFDAPVRVRAGRQIDYATPEFAHFDGLRVESHPLGDAKIVAGAYGGVPVRLYDATSIGDQIAGAWTEAQPWKGGRVRADWMYVHQEAETSDFNDDLVALSLWQRVGTQLLLDAGYARLEEEDRDVRLRATWNEGDGDLLVQASWYRLLNPQADFAYEFDPFYATLQQYEPFDEYRLLVSKALSDDLRLDLGGNLRQLDESEDESRLNHGYERAFATLILTDIGARGLDFSLTGDTWDSDEQDIRTWGADLTWSPNTTWRASAGSSYALYKFDVAQGLERDDVRVWYMRVRRKVGTAWTFQIAYDYEDDDFDDYHQIRAEATWRF